MQRVVLEKIKPGSITAESVKNSRGVLLCPAGFELSDRVLVRLRDNGVESVAIEFNEATPAALQERINDLHRRFEGQDDPLLLELKGVFLKQLVKLKQEAES